MVSRLTQWTLDVRDPAIMAAFWSAALGYEIDTDGQHLRPPTDAPAGSPTVWLQPTARDKRDKNPAHPDLYAPDGDPAAEVERLLAIGATRADVGQTGDEGFTVLADPEGNEFCVIHRPWRRT